MNWICIFLVHLHCFYLLLGKFEKLPWKCLKVLEFYWTLFKMSDARSLNRNVLLAPFSLFLLDVISDFRGCWRAFQREGGNVSQREELLQQNPEPFQSPSTFPPFTRHSVGDSIKSLTCDLFSEKQTASRVSQDQSHQRRAACAPAKPWRLSESLHHRKIVSCRSGEWLAWWYIDTLMQWAPWTVQ